MFAATWNMQLLCFFKSRRPKVQVYQVVYKILTPETFLGTILPPTQQFPSVTLHIIRHGCMAVHVVKGCVPGVDVHAPSTIRNESRAHEARVRTGTLWTVLVLAAIRPTCMIAIASVKRHHVATCVHAYK